MEAEREDRAVVDGDAKIGRVVPGCLYWPLQEVAPGSWCGVQQHRARDKKTLPIHTI